MYRDIDKDTKMRIERELKRLRVLPHRGEMIISVSPQGSIGNIKIITNH